MQELENTRSPPETPSHSQAEELKADPLRVEVDRNNYMGCSSCIGAATTAAQYMHVESMVQNF